MAAAKAATTTATPEAPVSDLLAGMEVVEKVTLPRRGRGVDPDTIAIRKVLVQQMEEGTARSFSNVDKEKRETFARKIRAAGKLTNQGDEKGEIKVSTRYDESAQKLIWGPESVLDALSKAS